MANNSYLDTLAQLRAMPQNQEEAPLPQFEPPMPPQIGPSPQPMSPVQVSPDLTGERSLEMLSKIGDVAKARMNVEKAFQKLRQTLANAGLSGGDDVDSI